MQAQCALGVQEQRAPQTPSFIKIADAAWYLRRSSYHFKVTKFAPNINLNRSIHVAFLAHVRIAITITRAAHEPKLSPSWSLLTSSTLHKIWTITTSGMAVVAFLLSCEANITAFLHRCSCNDLLHTYPYDSEHSVTTSLPLLTWHILRYLPSDRFQRWTGVEIRTSCKYQQEVLHKKTPTHPPQRERDRESAQYVQSSAMNQRRQRGHSSIPESMQCRKACNSMVWFLCTAAAAAAAAVQQIRWRTVLLAAHFLTYYPIIVPLTPLCTLFPWLFVMCPLENI